MTEIDTEFEENSFDDEYDPEDVENLKKNEKRIQKKAMALQRRAEVQGVHLGQNARQTAGVGIPGSTSNKLASMMQNNLGLSATPSVSIPTAGPGMGKPDHSSTASTTAKVRASGPGSPPSTSSGAAAKTAAAEAEAAEATAAVATTGGGNGVGTGTAEGTGLNTTGTVADGTGLSATGGNTGAMRRGGIHTLDDEPQPLSSADIADLTNTPRSLKLLSAQLMVRQTMGSKHNLNKYNNLPAIIYPVLLAEATRLVIDDAIVHLISTWPSPILNLTELGIHIDDYLKPLSNPGGGGASSLKETREKERWGAPCLADSIVRGLFYRRRKYCRLQMVILPKDSAACSDLLRYFARVPIHYLRTTPAFNIAEALAQARLKEAPAYLNKVSRLDLKRPINYYAFTKDNVRVVIAVPNCVIHWLGHKCNIDDVHAGLALQRHAPFEFHFDNIALINFCGTKALANVLDLVARPQNVKKILIKNKRVFKPDHIVVIVSTLLDTLRRYTGLVGLFTKISAVMTHHFPDNFVTMEAKEKLAQLYASLPNLRKLNFNDQPLEGHLPTLLDPVATSLTKISLVRCHLTGDDIDIIARSRHVNTLRYLRLDHNNLHVCFEQVYDLLSRLRVIERLNTVACLMKWKDCHRAAEALEHSTTLRRWNATDNSIFKLQNIHDFLVLCSKIPTLREVGIQPLDFHLLMDQVVVHSRKAYSEEKKQELYLIAAELNLIVF